MFSWLKNIFGKKASAAKVTRHCAAGAISALFKKLNIEAVEENSDSNFYICRFEFQGGAFLMYVSKTDRQVVIHYPWFMSEKEEFRPLVSVICNNLNKDYLDYVFTHSFNVEENSVGVHLKTFFDLSMFFDEDYELLKERLAQSFVYQRLFIESFNSNKEDFLHQNGSDVYGEVDKNERLKYLILEHEANAHGEDLMHHSLQDGSFRLGDLLEHLPHSFSLQDVKWLSFVSPKKTISEERKEQIPQFDIREAMKCDTEELFVQSAQVILRYAGANVIIDFNRESELDGKTVYYSVNMFDSWKLQTPEERNQVFVHCIVAFDVASKEELQAEVRYMLADAGDKIEEGKWSEMTQEQQALADFVNWDVSKDLYWGEKCFLNHRYVESIRHYEAALKCLTPSYYEMNRTQKNTVFEIYYKLGFCYSSLKNYPKAFYYLELAYSRHSIKGSIEYVNCLVNAKDFRAIGVINKELDNIQELMSEDDEEEDDENTSDSLEFYYKFLLRRKAFTFIDYKYYDEAETELRRILKMNDPEMTNFALSELSYIETRRKEEELEQKRKDDSESL